MASDSGSFLGACSRIFCHPFAFGVCLRKSLWKAGATLFFVYEIFCQVPEIVGEWLCLYAWILHFEYHLLDVFGYECHNFDF